ncbi:MAG: ABC transporter ATP-binding protein [Anaerolineales bacterium]|nr:ABC transporter ATP-binding protein [Anaerolineales bacterium]
MSTIIETRNVHRVFGLNGMTVEAVRGISLAVQAGEFVAIVGPSGSGKSSLLHMLGAMDRASQGEVLFEGQDLARLGDGQRTDLRASKIGFVFQTFNLMPTLNVYENIEIAMRLGGVPRRERRQRTGDLLAKVGLTQRARHLPRHLSGGERQRVAIARALANRPRLLLADEPTGNLDSRTGTGILELLRAVCSQDGQTVIIVTHDFRAASYADRVLVLRDGRIRGETRLQGDLDTHQVLGQLLELELG